MDGSENKTTLQRCRAWDALFIKGALHLDDLAECLSLQRRTVENLVNHEWFIPVKQGIVNIAYSQGTGRRLHTNAA